MIMSGFVTTLSQNLFHFNTSLSVKHISAGGTKHLSFICINASKELTIEFIRISGNMEGDSGTDLAPNTEVGFVICYLKQSATFSLNNFGIFGSMIDLNGMSNVGIIGLVPAYAFALLNNIVITGNETTEKKYLLG